MREYPNLIGQRFGKLVVEAQEESQKGQRRWLCRCDCGNTHIVTTNNLNCGRVTNCGCKKSPDLTGQVFGRLTVLGRSDKRGSRGRRTAPLWKCKCTCGAITYKATDVLTNDSESMCAACAGKYGVELARQAAGFVGGTQLSKIRSMEPTAANTSGCRGVYFDPKTNKYRARLKFRGKTVNLGTFDDYAEAVRVRKKAEEEIFGPFVSALNGQG